MEDRARLRGAGGDSEPVPTRPQLDGAPPEVPQLSKHQPARVSTPGTPEGPPARCPGCVTPGLTGLGDTVPGRQARVIPPLSDYKENIGHLEVAKKCGRKPAEITINVIWILSPVSDQQRGCTFSHW